MEKKNFIVSDVIAYHIVLNMSDGFNVGDAIKSPFSGERRLYCDKEIAEMKPAGLPSRNQALFVCLEKDFFDWVLAFGLHPSEVKHVKILKLELNGTLYWLDKNKMDKYHFDKTCRPNAIADSRESATAYWNSLLTNEELHNTELKDDVLYEGLFYGEAKIKEITEQIFKRP